MSFSIPGGGGGNSGATSAPAVHALNPEAVGPGAAHHPDAGPSFGAKLGNYFESKYPIAGGLANAVFGGQPASAPLGNLPTGAEGQNQPDLVAMNAQPKSGGGGGLQAILSLIGL